MNYPFAPSPQLPLGDFEVGELITDTHGLILALVTGFATFGPECWPVYLVKVLTGHEYGKEAAIFKDQARAPLLPERSGPRRWPRQTADGRWVAFEEER